MDRLAPSPSARRPATRQRLRPRPDAENFGGEVSFEPPSRFTSLDHLVGAGEQLVRHVEAKGLGRLEVDDQLELGRLHDWQVDWLRPFENACRVDANLPVRVDGVYSITHQPASCCIFTELINCRKAVVRRQHNQLTPAGIKEWIGRKDQRCGLLLNHPPKGSVDLVICARMKRINLQAERARGISHVVQLALGGCELWVIKEDNVFRLRHLRAATRGAWPPCQRSENLSRWHCRRADCSSSPNQP